MLREVRFGTGVGQPDYQVTRQPTATSTSGEVVLTVREANGVFCPGVGTETFRLSWSFGRDVTRIRPGDPPIPATVSAASVGKTGGCTTDSRLVTYLTALGSNGASFPASAVVQPSDQSRFGGFTPRAYGFSFTDTSPPGPATASGTINVAGHPINPARPNAYLMISVEGPGFQFNCVYNYAAS